MRTCTAKAARMASPHSNDSTSNIRVLTADTLTATSPRQETPNHGNRHRRIKWIDRNRSS